jgi:hypothetical protein
VLYRDERELRQLILLALYTARRSRPSNPAVPLMGLLELFGCSADEVQFTLWYCEARSSSRPRMTVWRSPWPEWTMSKRPVGVKMALSCHQCLLVGCSRRSRINEGSVGSVARVDARAPSQAPAR